MITDKDSHSSWWGDYALDNEQTLQWQIGPLLIQVSRFQQEWRIGYRPLPITPDIENLWSMVKQPLHEDDQLEVHRHVFNQTTEHFDLLPQLADRSVVIKSSVPVHIQVGQQLYFYVSTPLWLIARVHDPEVFLVDMPISRPSDTWFGSSTLAGELCYATTTQGRLDLEHLPVRPHRAISPVLIKNQSRKPLLLNKLSLPVPNLSLFDTEVHGLWTEAVNIVHHDEQELARVTVEAKPPEPFQQARSIHAAREKVEKKILTRTFSTLFS